MITAYWAGITVAAWTAGLLSGFWLAAILTTSQRPSGYMSDAWTPPCDHPTWEITLAEIGTSPVRCRKCHEEMPAFRPTPISSTCTTGTRPEWRG